MDEMLDIATVARYLGVSERTVYDRVRSGEIPAVKVGRLWRVRRTDLEGWLDRQRGVRESGGSPPSAAAGTAEGVPTRAQVETFMSEYPEAVDRRLAFVAMLSRAYEALGWTPPVIVGGHAVEFWTAGGYATVDIDLAGASEPAARILKGWGFEREGRHWIDERLGVVVELPAAQLDAGQREHAVRVDLGEVSVMVLGVEDLLLDRLNACVHWNDSESCLWARVLVDSAEKLDLAYVRTRASEEETLERLEDLLGEAEREDA